MSISRPQARRPRERVAGGHPADRPVADRCLRVRKVEPRGYVASCCAKKSSAARVFVAWSPPRLTPRFVRNARASPATSNAPVGRAPRRQLEHVRAVRVEPELADELAREPGGRRLQLENEDRPEEGQVAEADAFRRVLVVERTLCLREEPARRRRPGDDLLHRRRGKLAAHRAGADELPGHRVHLDLELRCASHALRKLRGDDRAELHDRVVAALLDPPRAYDETATVEREVGGRRRTRAGPARRVDRARAPWPSHVGRSPGSASARRCPPLGAARRAVDLLVGDRRHH